MVGDQLDHLHKDESHVDLVLVCAVDREPSMCGVVVMASWPLQGGGEPQRFVDI